ncbi:hypothetical protein [Candidatus Chlorohelix sp.]|uniref:hypothetical protein n=1 Tax=Candidatus Chlorohelix sp. TaxID=3139201 RepID=UPI0030402D2E
MNLIENWAVKIAAEITPNEIDLAPDMTAAYLAGGESRDQLYMQSKGGGLGGFGSGEVQVIFPIILSCITAASSAIVAILCAPQVGTILAVIKSVLEIKDIAGRQKKVSEELPEHAYGSLKQTLDAFSTGLKSVGYTQDQCDILTYRFMATLLEDPKSAQDFVKPFSASSKLNHMNRV